MIKRVVSFSLAPYCINVVPCGHQQCRVVSVHVPGK